MTDRAKTVGFEKIIRRLQQPDLVVIAADSGIATMALATRMLLRVGVLDKKKVVIFSQYVQREEWIISLLSSLSGVKIKKLQSGLLSQSDWRRICRAAGKIHHDSPIYINDKAHTNLRDIREELHFLDAYSKSFQQDLGLIVIDDPKIIPNHKDSLENVHVGGTFNHLKSLAKELGQPIVMFIAPTRLREFTSGVNEADLVIRPGRCASRYEAFVQRGRFTMAGPQRGDANTSGEVATSITNTDANTESFSEETEPESIKFPRHVCDVFREIECRYYSRPVTSTSADER